MCPKKFTHSGDKEFTPKRDKSLSEILQYEPPVLKENKSGTYIEFRAFDPEKGSLRRKTIKLNHIAGLTARRKYGKSLIVRLSHQLQQGWNPWICKDCENLSLFSDCVTLYENFIDKMYADGSYRRETYLGYKSYIKILSSYSENRNKIYYIYQFDKKYCSAFLDYIFIDRNCGAQTRNNYLAFLKVFSGFLVQKGFLATRPTEGIPTISKRLYQKERSLIPVAELSRITDFLKEHDPYFLTACYLLFYCFIRPVEMTRLRISNFNLQKSTITIQADISKNRKKQYVTLPKKVLLYMIGLGIFKCPMSDYLFSERLEPGAVPIDTKIFRDHWEKMRKSLKLPKTYKFYSLKDSGITELLDKNITSLSVRDQARHSSLEITDIYTRHDVKVIDEILNFDGSL